MLYVVIGIIVLFLIFIFVSYNSFIKANNRVKEAFATMDTYMKKRWDLIPNLVETVKGYAGYEKDTLESIIKARSNYDDMSQNEKLSTNEDVTKQISKIMMLSESYPELKANENFLDLSSNLTKVEDEIMNSRKYYNAVVRLFNNKVEMFPSNILAKIFGFKQYKMFEATDSERQNVKVDL